MTVMFDGVTLSTANYTDILNTWATLSVQSNVNFSGGESKYSTSTGRDILTNAPNIWVITDGGPA